MDHGMRSKRIIISPCPDYLHRKQRIKFLDNKKRRHLASSDDLVEILFAFLLAVKKKQCLGLNWNEEVEQRIKRLHISLSSKRSGEQTLKKNFREIPGSWCVFIHCG